MTPTNAAAIAKHTRYTGTIDGFARATRLMIAAAIDDYAEMMTGVPSGAWSAICTMMSLGTRTQPLEMF
jgi:hypothetical protein